jgi:hypothetical protein
MENLHSRRRKKHRNREVEANTRKKRIPKRDRRKRNQQDNRRKIKYIGTRQEKITTRNTKKTIILPYVNRKADNFSKRLRQLVEKNFDEVKMNVAFTTPATIGQLFPFKDNIKKVESQAPSRLQNQLQRMRRTIHRKNRAHTQLPDRRTPKRRIS